MKEDNKEEICKITNTKECTQNCSSCIKNTIERLQKEKKELKEINKIQKKQLDDAFTRGFIHKDRIIKKIEEIKKAEKTARECIEERVVIGDSDSLNYGRAEAHYLDLKLLEELLKESEK